MTKPKSKKKLADKVRVKKTASTTKINPFEVKINRQKHDVLGKKIAKHDRGMPGISKFKAIKKRKETLLVEYKKRGKSNKFVDRRFGETNPEMSVEDKMLERFALERQRGHEKSGLYNLNEDEELTHFGQSLSEIEKFDDPVSTDDDEDNGQLSGDLVREEHFGGFLTRKKTTDDDDEPTKKSWKERMEEIIAKSKKQKYEQQTEKDKIAEQTKQLDEEWKMLSRVLSGSKRTKSSTETVVNKADDYDIMVRELQFEIKGQATDRLKTEEEIAKEEREKLEKLEADRIRRMKGLTAEEMQLENSLYRSADDLDDGIILDKEVKFEVAYKDGKLLTHEEDGPEEGGNTDEQYVNENDEEEGEEEEEDCDGEDNDSEDEDSDDPMEHMSDLETSSEEDESSDSNQSKADDEVKKEYSTPVKFLKSSLKRKKPNPEEAESKLKMMQKEKEAAKRELPYTFKAPTTYSELLDLLQPHSEEDQLLLIDRLQKLYHPSLAEGNKQILETVYTLLVDYYCDLALQDPPLLSLLDALVKPLYQLTQRFPVHSGQTWARLIADRQREFTELTEKKGGRGCYPGLDVLLVFKLISVLYPTSDFRHSVVTPTMLFMSQILSQCPVRTMSDVAAGLLLSGIFLEYVSFAKRFIPEVINFLQGLLFTAVEKEAGKIEQVCPPFKPVGKNINLLKLEKSCKTVQIEPLKISKVFSRKSSDYLHSDCFKVLCLYQCLKLTAHTITLYRTLPSFLEIYSSLIHFIKRLPLKRYPKEIGMLSDEIMTSFNPAPKRPLVLEKERPKPLKMFEPVFDDKFDGKKKRIGSRETQEKQRLLHKYKKELKGAVRCLRQDNMFLAREKLQEQLERDAERKAKVNQLYQELAMQEGDFNALKRKKITL